MTTYRVQAPDGKVIEIEGPPGASEQEVMMRARSMHTQATKGAKKSIGQEVEGFMANVNRGMGFGDELVGALGAAGDVIGGKVKSFDDLGKSFENRMAQQRQTEDDFAQRRPNTAALAQGTGAASTMILPSVAGQNAMVQAAPRGASIAARAINAGQNAARVGTAAGASGAVYGAMDRGTVQERLAAASQGADSGFKMGALAGPILGAVETRRQNMPQNRPRTAREQHVDTLVQEGVQLTPGQANGGMAKVAEDAATSLPFLGQAITRARNEGLGTYTRAAVNRGLHHIGEELPEGMTGTEAIRHAGDVFSREYEAIVPQGGVVGDEGFAQSINGLEDLIATLRPENQAHLRQIIESRVASRLRPTGAVHPTGSTLPANPGGRGRQVTGLDGRTYQRVQSELKNDANRFSASTDPDHRAMSDAIDGVADALEEAATRQNPEFGARLASLNRGYAEHVLAEGAASKAGAHEGNFGPTQYNQTVKSADKSVRRPGGGSRGFARGDSLGYDLAQAGREIMPSQVGNSGTADRAALGAAITAPIGGAGALLSGHPDAAMMAMAAPAAIGAGLGAASTRYSPAAMQAYNRALAEGVTAREQMQAASQLRQLAAQDPAVMELYRDVVSRIPRAIGATVGR